VQCMRDSASATWRLSTVHTVRLVVVRHRHFLDGWLRRRLSRHLAQQTVHDVTHRRRHHRPPVSGPFSFLMRTMMMMMMMMLSLSIIIY